MNEQHKQRIPEWVQAAGWGLLIMAVTCLPLLRMWWSTPLDGEFPWVLFNSDDHGVYFAWMRQARDGHLLFRSLFTNHEQLGIYPHLYFLLLGWVARVPGLSIPMAYLLGRVFFGTLTLVLVHTLAGEFTRDRFTRWCVFWTTALSAGLGWVVWSSKVDQRLSVDVWQPEALTFPSLYANGLFCVALALMLGIVICLLRAETRGTRWAVGAGLCGLVLGNIHSYDMIHLTAAWTAYLGLRWWVGRRFPAEQFRYALVAAVIAAPSVAFMFWLYKHDPVFQARADTATLTPRIWLYLAGYGLLWPLAIWGARLLWSAPTQEVPLTGKEPAEEQLRKLMPLGWAVAGLAVAYVPVAFQRKMIMGYHFPLALLAGIAVAELARRVAARTQAWPQLSLSPGVVAAAVVLALSLTNWRFLTRDMKVALTEGVTSTGIHPVYWPTSEVHAFEWLGAHSPADATLLTYPINGVFAPFWSGRTVYAGHWAETPEFEDKMRETLQFYWHASSDERLAFLREHHLSYVLLTPMETGAVEAANARRVKDRLPAIPERPLDDEPFLEPVFREGQTTLYAVRG